MTECVHRNVNCINEYELIRKYECSDCGAIMMCSCDEAIGRKFLPHQLRFDSRLESQEEVHVILGFQASICNECRGLPVKAFPKASLPGQTSNIKRYYWRELDFREYELFEQYGGIPSRYLYQIGENESEAVRKAREQALVDIKRLHETKGKYSYQKESNDSILKKYEIFVRNVHAEYEQDGSRKSKIRYNGELVTVEKYAEIIYQSIGYDVLFAESRPFHVLFSVFTFPLIQSPIDPKMRMTGFGERSAYEADRSKNPIWTPLPLDFGTSGYAKRCFDQIEKYFNWLSSGDREGLLWFFDSFFPYSYGLRQYLWAHREEDAITARRIVEILEPAKLLKIVRYLTDDYWKRYIGWPDLLIFNSSGYKFVEVKSSKDKLSEEQKDWIENNHNQLHLPFEIFKVHRAANNKKA